MYSSYSFSKACGANICYSQAMSETAGWYDDVHEKMAPQKVWLLRGGQMVVSSGIFAIVGFSGSTTEEGVVNTANTTRPTIVVY